MCCRGSLYELLQVKRPLRDYVRVTAFTKDDAISHTHTQTLCPQCCWMKGFPVSQLFTNAFIHFSIFDFSPQHPSRFLSHSSAISLLFIPFSSFPFLHSALGLSLYFFLLSSHLSLCTAVQMQISVFVPVRQRHGKLHAKTQSANADEGGGVWTSVHTKLIWIARWNESHLLNWKIYFCPPCFNLGGGVEVNLFFYKISFLY